MKVLRIVGMSVVAVAALIAPFAMAQMGSEQPMHFACPEMGPQMHMMRSPAAWILSAQDQLNLTDNQVKQLTELDTQYRLKQIDRKAAIEKKVIQLRQASRDDTMSKDQMKALIDDIAKGYSDMAMAWIDAKDQAKQVLTPEQRDTLKNMRFDMGGMGAMRGPMMRQRMMESQKSPQKRQ
ncbi:MAG TPA: Spy/CpxP family protein refolding chaperone [Planctomycetota bacterium]|nr:Spy/CpxP family protein refolding chaperone [Planctomycetota bacterium]